jgi:hypothetical protein
MGIILKDREPTGATCALLLPSHAASVFSILPRNMPVSFDNFRWDDKLDTHSAG